MKYKYVTLDGREIEFKTLPAEEADRFCQRLKSKDVLLEEYIFQNLTDNKYPLEELEAGIVQTIIFLAFKLSGVLKAPLDFPDKIESSRTAVKENAYYALYSAITKAFCGKYSLEELKKKSLNELMELFAVSESILGLEVIDTAKVRKSVEESEEDLKSIKKKGVQSVTEEELNLINNLISNEEMRADW